MSPHSELPSPVDLDTFASTKSFKFFYDEALRDSHDVIRSCEPLGKYLADVRGSLFEAFAFEYLAQMPEHTDLLSPDDTAEFMREQFYPGRTFVNRSFGRKDIPGDYMPDGVNIQDGVYNFFEYTTNRKFETDIFKMKCRNFKIHCKRYGIDRATLTFVLPTGIAVPEFIPDTNQQYVVGPPIILPVEADKFSEFASYVYNRYRTRKVNPKSPTLAEYRAQTVEPQY